MLFRSRVVSYSSIRDIDRPSSPQWTNKKPPRLWKPEGLCAKKTRLPASGQTNPATAHSNDLAANQKLKHVAGSHSSTHSEHPHRSTKISECCSDTTADAMIYSRFSSVKPAPIPSHPAFQKRALGLYKMTKSLDDRPRVEPAPQFSRNETTVVPPDPSIAQPTGLWTLNPVEIS